MTEAETWCEIARDFRQLMYAEPTDFTERLADALECAAPGAGYSAFDDTEQKLLELLKREIRDIREWITTDGRDYYDDEAIDPTMAKMDERLGIIDGS